MDETENIRREVSNIINSAPGERQNLERAHGQVWDTEELRKDFEVTGFLAPFVVAIRKSDGVKGSLMFQHSPRLYWGFKKD